MNPSSILLEVEPGRGLNCDTGIHLTTVRNIKVEKADKSRPQYF